MGRGYLRQFESELAVLYRLADVVVIFAMLWISMSIRGVPWSEEYVLAGVLACVAFYLCAHANGVYRSWRTAPLKESLWPVLLSWVLTVFALLFTAYVAKRTGEFSRIAVSTWMILVPITLLGWRYGFWKILRYMRANGYNQRSVAIAGVTERAAALSRYIEETPEAGMNLVGFFDDRERRTDRNLECGRFATQGSLDELVERTCRQEIDVVYVALPLEESRSIQYLLDRLSDSTASVYLIPDLLTAGILGSRWLTIGSTPAVSIYETPFFGIDGLAKRLEDIVLGALILSIIALPMLLIAVGVKLSSPGPVLFKQQRYGLDGRRIRVWKFRTMRCCEDGDSVRQATLNDTRVTRFGAFLRRTSLDELPQFINVLAGDMSVVGPRPHAVAHNEQYRRKIQGYMLRHKVKPGITGWAQVNGWRGETDSLHKMEKRIEHDLWYIRNWSLLLDLRLVVWTVLSGFGGRNAY
jgi:putative colanic acid biosynthesis UDP-glucose lipid carrier transferase